MIVVDASVIVDFLLRSAEESEINRLFAENPIVAAPEIWAIESISSIRKRCLLKQVEEERAKDALDTLLQIHIESHAVLPMRPHIWALRENVSAYDASYVALASVLEIPLFTRDAKLVNAPIRGVKIVLI